MSRRGIVVYLLHQEALSRLLADRWLEGEWEIHLALQADFFSFHASVCIIKSLSLLFSFVYHLKVEAGQFDSPVKS